MSEYPSMLYRVFYLDRELGMAEIFADGYEIDSGVILFYVQKEKGEVLAAGINSRAIAHFTSEPYHGPESIDPGPTLRDSDEGWSDSLVSPGNPFVTVNPGMSQSAKPDLSKPKPDPFRGNRLKEKK
jgi:hypothetical protein